MSIDVLDANGTKVTISTIADLMAVVATAAAQATGNTALANILTKLADPATQTTLVAVLAKLSDDPATATGVAALAAKLDQLHTDLATTLAGYVDGLETLVGATNTGNSAIFGKLSGDPSTETTLAGVKTSVDALAALISGGALTTALDSGSPGIIETGTAGLPSATVLSVQGVASGTAQPISGTVSITDISNGEYETVAASQTDQALGATGAAGDWLEGILIVPATSAAGAVSIKDGSGSSITIFAGGGTTALPTLAPIYVPLGIKSTGGAWKVTTGANVSAIGIGNFT